MSEDGHDHDKTPVCGEPYEMHVTEQKQISLQGFNATVKRVMDATETKVVLSDFKFVPIISTDGAMVTIKAGDACDKVNDLTSAAFSVAGLTSYAMGYPMVTAAALLSANFLPVGYASDEACELAPIVIEIYTMSANSTAAAVETKDPQSDD